jgi:acyl carrier protein
MFEQLKTILVNKFQVPGDQVVPGATLADLDLDSLDIVELAMLFQKEMSASISEDELGELAKTANLDAIAQLVESRRVTV